MEEILVKCPAKINLSLDVIGKRNDGYHELQMIMQSVALYDEILIEKSSKGITVNCDNLLVPDGEKNICYKIASILFERYKLNGGININIKKQIPVAAGLAGGSTDAAGVIEGINSLYGLDMSIDEMLQIGKCVGADVPFCVYKGTALAKGVGEFLTRLNGVDAWVVLAKPDISVSTAGVFSEFKLDEIIKRPDTELMIKLINEGNLEGLAENMVNVLETVTIKKYPIISEIKNIMLEFGASGSLMSGSGPTVFGIFQSKSVGEKCYHRLRDYLKEVYFVKTVF